MSIARVAIGITALAMCSTVALGQSANGPSFNCDEAWLAAEVAVCESRRLSRLDARMDRNYQTARNSLRTYRARRRLRSEQKNWLEQRNACESNRRCLRTAYESRVSTLEALNNPDDDYASRGDGPSFSCQGALTRAEQRICSSARLSRLDREMDASYRDVLSNAQTWRARRKVKREQDDWLTARDSCRRDYYCILDAYQARIADLKHGSRPAYQRTAAWRKQCLRSNMTSAGKTTCNTEELWQLRARLLLALSRAKAAMTRNRSRRRLDRDQVRWSGKSWEPCRSNVRCLRRAYRSRIADLKDGPRQPVVARYQQTAVWQDRCRRTDLTRASTAVCNTRELWNLRSRLLVALADAKAATNRSEVRRQIDADQVRWSKNSFEVCRKNVRCLRRAYLSRISDLKDGARQPVIAGYKQTAAWQNHCRRTDLTRASAAVCNTGELWNLRSRLLVALADAKAATNRNEVRRQIDADQVRWSKNSFEVCRKNVRCLRRAYLSRISDLRTTPRTPPASGDYKQTTAWRKFCYKDNISPSRITTCHTRELWDLWTTLHVELADARAANQSNRQRNKIDADQKRWLTTTWNGCQRNVNCLRQAYRGRISDLR